MGFAAAHPEQPPLYNLAGIGLQVDQHRQQSILRRGQWTVRVGGVPAGGAWLPIEAPLGQMGLERGLKGWDQALKLVDAETGYIQYLRGAGLDVDEPETSHGCSLPSAVPPLHDQHPQDDLHGYGG